MLCCYFQILTCSKFLSSCSLCKSLSGVFIRLLRLAFLHRPLRVSFSIRPFRFSCSHKLFRLLMCLLPEAARRSGTQYKHSVLTSKAGQKLRYPAQSEEPDKARCLIRLFRYKVIRLLRYFRCYAVKI